MFLLLITIKPIDKLDNNMLANTTNTLLTLTEQLNCILFAIV